MRKNTAEEIILNMEETTIKSKDAKIYFDARSISDSKASTAQTQLRDLWFNIDYVGDSRLQRGI